MNIIIYCIYKIEIQIIVQYYEINILFNNDQLYFILHTNSYHSSKLSEILLVNLQIQA